MCAVIGLPVFRRRRLQVANAARLCTDMNICELVQRLREPRSSWPPLPTNVADLLAETHVPAQSPRTAHCPRLRRRHLRPRSRVAGVAAPARDVCADTLQRIFEECLMMSLGKLLILYAFTKR